MGEPMVIWSIACNFRKAEFDSSGYVLTFSPVNCTGASLTAEFGKPEDDRCLGLMYQHRIGEEL
jgi:hypothetical protein